eukprot:365083-Chlamydomonas_euryale.AAC.13
MHVRVAAVPDGVIYADTAAVQAPIASVLVAEAGHLQRQGRRQQGVHVQKGWKDGGRHVCTKGFMEARVYKRIHGGTCATAMVTVTLWGQTERGGGVVTKNAPQTPPTHHQACRSRRRAPRLKLRCAESYATGCSVAWRGAAAQQRA